MATIQIAESSHPRYNSQAVSTGINGVYSSRNLSRTSLGYRSSRGREEDRPSLRSGAAEDEDGGLRRNDDFRQRQVFTRKTLFFLAYQSIGVIYGDIGTSPLYVFSSTFSSDPSYQDLIGVLSIIIWSLTMMVTVKYVLIILHADNEGEGGTFSTYSLLARFANITKHDPHEQSMIKMERYLTGDLEKATQRVRNGLENSKFARGLLRAIGVLAVSMVMSDGVLTPAQSVLGAVQGLEVVKPDIGKSTIVGTTCGILVLLFLIQPFGTGKIATSFAPIVIIWLAFNAVFGIFNLIKFDHSVLKAFNPAYAFEFMSRRKEEGWRMLGGVLLAFTGVEALFADLGAFSRHAIQLSWMCYTFPCLLLAYIGQAAYISVHPGSYKSPFFNSAPPGTLYPSLIIAVLAAIVASQAIITATFQLLGQIMKLSYFPHIKIVHTSATHHGQIYIPFLNWILMVGTILIAAIYNNTTSLGNAYGVCVMFVTLFDTCMVSLAALLVWRISPYIIFLPFLTIAALDGLYLSSALTKVPDGAWFTLILSGLLTCLFILWRYGKEQQWAAEAADRFPTSHFLYVGPEGLQLTEAYGGEPLSQIRGFGVFFDKAGEKTPLVFQQFISKLVAVTDVMVFLHLRPLETPSVLPESRYSVSRMAIPNCYRLIIRHGYADVVITPDLGALVCEQIHAFLVREHAARVARKARSEEMEKTVELTLEDTSTSVPALEMDLKPESELRASDKTDLDSLTSSLSHLRAAFAHQKLFIVGKEQMKIRAGTRWIRALPLNIYLWIRDNTRSKIADLKLPSENLIEVGFLKEL